MVLSYQGMTSLSVVVPGSIIQYGWNVHQWKLPTTVHQDSLIKKMANTDLDKMSWSDWQVELSTTVTLPVLGIPLSKSIQMSLDLGKLMAQQPQAPTPSSNPSNSSNTSSTNNTQAFIIVSPREILLGSESFSASQQVQFGVDLADNTNRSVSVHGSGGVPMPDISSSYWNNHLEGGAIVILPAGVIIDIVQSKNFAVESAYLARVGGTITLQAYWQATGPCLGLKCPSRTRVVGAISNISVQMDEANEDVWVNVTSVECKDVFTQMNCSFPLMNFTDLTTKVSLRVTGRPAQQCPFVQYALNFTDKLTLEEFGNLVTNSSKAFSSSQYANESLWGRTGFEAIVMKRLYQVSAPPSVPGSQLWLGFALNGFYSWRALDDLYLGGGGLLNVYSYAASGSPPYCPFVANSSVQLGINIPNGGSPQFGLVLNRGMDGFANDIAPALVGVNKTNRCFSFQGAAVPDGFNSSLIFRLLQQFNLSGSLEMGNGFEMLFDWVADALDLSKVSLTARSDGLFFSQEVSYPGGFVDIPRIDLAASVWLLHSLTPNVTQYFALINVEACTGFFLNSASVRVTLRDTVLDPNSTLGALGPFAPPTMLSYLASSFLSGNSFPHPLQCLVSVGGFNLQFEFPFPRSAHADPPAIRTLSARLTADSATPNPLCFCSAPAFTASLQMRNVFAFPVVATSWSVGGNVTVSASTAAALTSQLQNTSESLELQVCDAVSQTPAVQPYQTTQLNLSTACSFRSPCLTNGSSCPAKSGFNITDSLPTRVRLSIRSPSASWSFEVITLAQP